MKTQIYQICYSPETLASVPEGFLTLDNLRNERPDWREYWPIRNFLLSNHLSDDVLYGFMSPKFTSKTGLKYEDIQQFLKSNYENHDIVSFSPFWDLSCIFKNVFEQGDFFHTGLANACQEFSESHLSGIDLINSITHSENTIFCNYFLAKKRFWILWLELGELLYEASNKEGTDLSIKLNSETNYGIQKLPMKIFIQERLASICLLLNKNIKCLAYDSFKIGPSNTLFNQFLSESILSNSLKFSYEKTHNEVYLEKFSEIRNEIIKKINTI